MPIAFRCSCGVKLTLSNSYAGKEARCIVCRAVCIVPVPEPVKVIAVPEIIEEIDDVEEVVETTSPPPFPNYLRPLPPPLPVPEPEILDEEEDIPVVYPPEDRIRR